MSLAKAINAQPELTDDALVAAARSGEEAAVRLLIRRNNLRLFRVARAVLRDDAEAEDVVQATYIKAFTQLEGYRGEAAFSTWLTRIALNEALSRRRRQRPKVDIEMIDEQAARSGAQVIAFPLSLVPMNPEAEMGRVEMRALLEEMIDELPEPLRLVLVLRDIEEMNVEETATFLAIKPQTVKTRLHRARRQLRAMLEQRLSPVFSEVFPFDGQRCVDLAGRVVARLRAVGALL
jgi:RNA polymerase sigma-70 factor (ECF subfamily)